jgi:hypothetical protein
MLLNLISTTLGLLTVLAYVVLCARLDRRADERDEDPANHRVGGPSTS